MDTGCVNTLNLHSDFLPMSVILKEVRNSKVQLTFLTLISNKLSFKSSFNSLQFLFTGGQSMLILNKKMAYSKKANVYCQSELSVCLIVG